MIIVKNRRFKIARKPYLSAEDLSLIYIQYISADSYKILENK